MDTPGLGRGRAAAFLRLAFAAAFTAQTAVAVVIGVIVSALAGAPPRPSSLLAWTLVGLAIAQLPVGVLAATARLGSVQSRQSALSRALFAGVTLSTTAWFASLALATGQRGVSVYVLLAVLSLAYALGFLATGRLAGAAASAPPRKRPTVDADEAD